MPKYFSITAVTVSIELNAATREGQASFTVTNATQASFGGDAIVVAPQGSDDDYKEQFAKLQFDVQNPSRHYDPGAAEQLTVKVTAPPELPKGSYGFVLRMLLAGGVPEEQYDDAPVVAVVVPEVASTSPPPRRIPWWLILIGIVAALVILIVVVWLLWPKPGPTPSPSPSASATTSQPPTVSPTASPVLTGDQVLIVSAIPVAGTRLNGTQPYTLQFNIRYSLDSLPQARLYISIAQTFTAGAPCSSAGSLVTSNYALINHGSGETTVTVPWPGDTGSGYIAPAPSLWTADKSSRLVYFGTDTNYCYPYGP